MPHTEARRLAQRCCCLAPCLHQNLRSSPPSSPPFCSYRHRGQASCPMPALHCLALPQLNWTGLRFNCIFLHVPATLPSPSPSLTLTHPRPHSPIRSPIRSASAFALPLLLSARQARHSILRWPPWIHLSLLAASLLSALCIFRSPFCPCPPPHWPSLLLDVRRC